MIREAIQKAENNVKKIDPKEKELHKDDNLIITTKD